MGGPHGWCRQVEKEKIFCPPMGRPNPIVQPVASHHNIQAISLPSHTEGEGMNVAYRRGRNNENFIS